MVSTPPSGARYPAGAEYPTGPKFARFRVYQDSWSSPQYTAEQVLAMITQMHPDVLERMTTNAFDVGASVPVCSGCAAMNYGQFLNASMNDCGCYIMPRLDINLTWPAGTFTSDAQKILNTPVSPRFEILSIDNWDTFCKLVTSCTCNLAQQVFQPLYNMGWKGVGVMDAGSYVSTCGWATFADMDIQGNTWTVNQNLFNNLKGDNTLQKILLYAPDFPNEAQKFLGACSPNCDADISLLEKVVSQQASQGYSYVYPVEQTFWDANNITTSAAGTYHGQTLYQIFLAWMQRWG